MSKKQQNVVKPLKDIKMTENVSDENNTQSSPVNETDLTNTQSETSVDLKTELTEETMQEESKVIEPVIVVPPIVPEVNQEPLVEETKNITTMGKLVLNAIQDYIDNMGPNKPVSQSTTSRYQISLFRNLMLMLDKVDDDFETVYSMILKQAHELRDGVFHEAYLFRAFDYMPISELERKQFQRLLNLIKVTADPQSRNLATKQVDFGKTLEPFAESVKQKILTFYRL